MAGHNAVASMGPLPLSAAHLRWRRKVLVSTYLAYAGFYLCRKVFSLAKPVIKEDLHLTYDQIAYIWTAFLVAYMLGQFVTSFVGRKWAPKTLLVGGLGISMAINLVFGFANNYYTFFVFMIFNGIVQATGWPSSVGAVAHWIRPEERGLLMGLWSTSHVVGTLVVKLIGGLLLAYVGWHWTFGGATAVAALFWALLIWWHHDRPEDVGLTPIVTHGKREEHEVDGVHETEDGHLTMGQYFKLAFHPVVLTMGTAYLCVKFLRYALDSWLPTFLVVMGLSIDKASYYSMGFDVFGILPAVLAGWALDRLFRGNWALLSLVAAAGMIVGFFVVLQAGASPVAVAFSFGLVGFMIFGPETILSGAASVQVAGERNGLAVAGIVNGLGSIGPIFQELIIGFLMGSNESQGLRNTNLMCLGLSVLFMFLMAIAAWRRNKVLKNEAAARTASS